MPNLGPSSVFDLGALRNRLGETVDDFSQHRRNLTRLVVAAGIVICGWLLFHKHDNTARVEASIPRVASSPTSTTEQTNLVVVDVSGAVAKPGVYKIANDARVSDAVDAAGGLTDDADIERLNRAAKVSDGQRIFVVHKGQQNVPPDSTSQSDDAQAAGPLDLNTASETQLEQLPGVGPATAKAIIDFRTKNGSFKSVQDLQKIKGIGQAKFAQLRDLVRV